MVPIAFYSVYYLKFNALEAKQSIAMGLSFFVLKRGHGPET